MDLVRLERRMEGLRTIREILAALRALSSIQYKRSKDALDAQRAFEVDLRSAVASVPSLHAPVASPRSVLLVVLGSDQGFCGPLVSRLVATALDHVRRAPRSVKYLPMAVGTRTHDALAPEFEEDVPRLSLVASPRSLDGLMVGLASEVEQRIALGAIDGVDVVYARHEAPGRYAVEVTRLFPVDPDTLPQPSRAKRVHEPSSAVFAHLLVEWVYAELFRVVLEAQASEHGARMRTTDSATRAMDERLEQLTMDHHRERQAQATAEVLEIISSAEVTLRG